MSDWAPQESAGGRRLQHLSQVHRSIQRRRRERALGNSVLTAAEHSDDPYLSKLSKTSRRVAGLGLNGQEFFKAPGAYQFISERDDSDPDGFLDRMAQRARDGDLLNQRGRVGFAAMFGDSDIDAALKDAAALRGRMSSQDWLQRQTGIEKQLGFASEMIGQQLRNVPTALLMGATALGTGALVGSIGGPAGALAGAAGLAGVGFTAGMAVENTQMMAGLTFLDLMEEPLRLADGTEARMPVEVARGVGMVVGAVQGALETAQVASVFGMVPGARQLANKAMTRLIATGKVRQLAVRAGSRIASGTAENVLEEMLQELTGMVGTEVALDMVKNKTGAERVEAQKFADEFWKRIGEVAKMAPAFGILSGPQAAVGAVVDQHRASPERMFDPEPGGEVVPIDNLVIPEAVNERQRATTTALIEQVQRGIVRLPPIRIARDEAGNMQVAIPDEQALVAGLRSRGIRAVRVMDEAVVAAEQEAAAVAAPAAAEEQPAAEPAAEEEMTPKARKGPVAISSMSAFSVVQQQFLEGTAGTDITPEQATMATILLERVAQSSGKDLMTVAQEWFEDKIFADKETTAQIMEDLVEEAEEAERAAAPVEPERPAPGREAIDTTPEPTVTASMRPGDESRERSPAAPAEPSVTEAPSEGPVPQWARENFAEQQRIMRRLPGDIGKARREGTLTPRHERALEQLDTLRERLPQESDVWQQIMQEERERYDQELATQRANTRADTEVRMADEGWSVGDKVWLPEVNMLTGQVLHRQQGTVKINKAGTAYVAGAGKQFSLFDRVFQSGVDVRVTRWTRVGEEPEAKPPPRPEPTAVQVEPTTFAEIPEISGDSRDSSGIAVWEGNDGRLEVLAGYWRATMAKHYQERTEAAFTVPAVRYREADGVSLEAARAHALTGLDQQKERELLPAVRFLRGLPINDQLESVRSAIPPSLPLKDVDTVIGLNAVDDEVFGMVERGDLKMEHAAYLSLLPDRNDQVARALAMIADPPRTEYEANLRSGFFGLIDPETGAPYPGETVTARMLVEVANRIEDRPGDERVKAIVGAAERMTAEGGPLHEQFRQRVSRRGTRRGDVLRMALPTMWGTYGPFDGLVDQVDQGTLSQEDAADQVLDALARAVEPPPPVPSPERVQEVIEEAEPARERPPVGPKVSKAEAEDATRERLREKLSLERIDESIAERPAPPTAPPERAPESKAAPAQTAYQETTKGITKPTTNPTPKTAPTAPPVKRPPVKVEDASKTELLDGLEAMFDDERTETDILYSDGAAAPSKMARIIQRLVEVLMIDEGHTMFPAFAENLMQTWGNRKHRDRVFVAMRDWYEAGREADVAPDMTAPAEIDRWYKENADVVDRPGRKDDEREPEAEGRPDAGRGDQRPRPVDAAERPPDGGEVQRPGRERDPDAAERGARDRDRADEGRDRERDGIPPSVESTDNWHFDEGQLDATETRGPSLKARDNVAALELLKQLQKDGRQATPDEQAVLAKYVGWGGLAPAFPDPGTGAFGKGLEQVGARLQELLTEEEYAAARRSIQYAHYTSETVINFMWRMAQGLGFAGGRVIEPGAGVGHFAGLLPGELAKASTYFGVEVDPVTAAIAAQLYPHWTLRQQDYSRTAVPPDLFDLAIGNPPFANFRPSDPKYEQHKFLLHDYFFAKTLDGVRPGGIMAFVTSAGTMNKQNAKARQYLADRADFIGAVRLPNTAFRRNAGTEVTADVLFFRRRALGAPENHVAPWVESVEQDMPTRTGETAKGYVNQYFLDHPDMVLGDPGLFDELVAGLRYSVRQRPGANLEADLTTAGARLIEQAPAFAAARAASPLPGAVDLLSAEMKEGSYYISDDGEMRQFRMGAGREPRRPGSKGKLVKMSKKDQAMVRDLLPVRDTYRAVLAADLGDDTAASESARAELNRSYDTFVAEYGPIRKTITSWRKVKADELETARQRERERARAAGEPWDEGTFDDTAMIAAGAKKSDIARARQAARDEAAAAGRPFDEGTFDPAAVGARPMTKMPNLQPFLGDPEAYRVMALEKGYDEDTGVAEKSEVFERNIIRRPPEAKIDTALDAMLHVLTTTGQFDIGAISAAWGRSEQETRQELGDLTYHDPLLGEWTMGEEYLSGNVVRKLQQAREAALANPDYQRNVRALEAVQPKNVGPNDIAVKVGSSWIPTDVYEAFAAEVLQIEGAQITHNVEMNLWNVEGVASQSGLAEYGAHQDGGGLIYGPRRLMSEVLRQKALKAPRHRDAEGHSYADKEGDIKVAEAIKHMQDAFQRWIWTNQTRTEQLVDLYNGKFNTTVERDYRTDYITTPGVADWWQWRPHQLRGIARIIVAGNTYLNHAVGAGKTSTMIAAAMGCSRRAEKICAASARCANPCSWCRTTCWRSSAPSGTSSTPRPTCRSRTRPTFTAAESVPRTSAHDGP